MSFNLQGEDGFPGFKGDMGLKGDKVKQDLQIGNSFRFWQDS